jgi:hypothetical protein
MGIETEITPLQSLYQLFFLPLQDAATISKEQRFYKLPLSIGRFPSYLKVSMFCRLECTRIAATVAFFELILMLL